MTLQTQQPTPENAPAILTDEQRRRVADALESAPVGKHSQKLRQPVRKISSLV